MNLKRFEDYAIRKTCRKNRKIVNAVNEKIKLVV